MGKFLAPKITTADRTLLLLEDGELVYDTDLKTFYQGDGVTMGGIVMDAHIHLNQAVLDATTASFTIANQTKLNGIEAGAEVNNISDPNATDLTDGGDSTLHYHASDRNRTNHTGTQTASTISDFDVEVGNNTDVAANTAARHTHSNIAILDLITEAFTSALKTAYDSTVTWISTNGATLISHLSNTSNPHSVTKTQVGLSNVDNTSDLLKPLSTATISALALKYDNPTGTPDGTKYLRDDNTWQPVAGAGTTISGTAVLNFGVEEEKAELVVANGLITNAALKSISLIPTETVETSLDDFSLNGVYCNVEDIIDNTSFKIRATAINMASGNYTIKYIINT